MVFPDEKILKPTQINNKTETAYDVKIYLLNNNQIKHLTN